MFSGVVEAVAASIAADAVRGAARPSGGEVGASGAYRPAGLSMPSPVKSLSDRGSGPGSLTATPVRPTPEPNGAPVLPMGLAETKTGVERVPNAIRSVPIPTVGSPAIGGQIPVFGHQTAAQRVAASQAAGAAGGQPSGVGGLGLDPALLSLLAIGAAIFLRA